MKLSIIVERVPGDKSGSDFVARVELPCGEAFSSKATNIPQALGLLLACHPERFSDGGSELRGMIDNSVKMGIPGVEALGLGLVHRLPWTTSLLDNFDWPDFSVRSERGFPLTSSNHYLRKPLAELLRQQESRPAF
jgi:hypothetical protein